jgi:hypothetical protein
MASAQQMRKKITVVIAGIVVANLILTFCLLFRQPFWGLNGPFPFTVLRSVRLPLVMGIGSALVAVTSKSAIERKRLYFISIAAIAQIIVVKGMLWLDQPLLIILVLMLANFMAYQMLQYGCDYLLGPHSESNC